MVGGEKKTLARRASADGANLPLAPAGSGVLTRLFRHVMHEEFRMNDKQSLTFIFY
jgi:hypothetical protein